MEDFGFKLQDLKYKFWIKRTIQIVFILLAILFFIIISIKLVKLSIKGEKGSIENIVLIKSQTKEIKRSPEGRGGLNIDNLDISVYDVIDNKKNNDELKVNKTKQSININDNNISKTSEQELLSQKISEINEDDEPIMANESMDGIQKSKTTTNITIKSDSKISSTNIKELQRLGNNSLIKNIQDKKDVKPGVKVQILALRSREGLEQYWNGLKAKYQNLLNDKNYYIEQANLEDTGVIYRLQVGNFKDKESAADFCKEYIRVTNKNKIDCIVI